MRCWRRYVIFLHEIEAEMKTLAIALDEIESVLKAVNQRRLNYPLGKNLVIKPAPTQETWEKLLDVTKLPQESELAQFFLVCNGVVAVDVCNGYFIHSAELIISQFCNGEPIRITAPISANILVIGSDGGGSRFAVDRNNWSDVYCLHEGIVEYDATFDGDTDSVELQASSFLDFLVFLRDEIAECVQQHQ
jgi:hypothetical protein